MIADGNQRPRVFRYIHSLNGGLPGVSRLHLIDRPLAVATQIPNFDISIGVTRDDFIPIDS
jgi:hypothetical protein